MTGEPSPSVSSALFDGYPMAMAVDEIAASGARSLEPAFIGGYVTFDEETAFTVQAASDLSGLARKAGLNIHAVSAHFDLSSPDARGMLRRRIDFAGALGAAILITNAGPRDGREHALRMLDAALPWLESAGICLALENPGHGAGDLLADGAAGLALIAPFNTPFLRLNYDVGNVLTYSGGDILPELDIVNALPFVAHVHLKDVRDDGAGWTFTALGEGNVTFETLLPRIPRHIPVGIELPLRLTRPGRADPRRSHSPVDLTLLRSALKSSLALVSAWNRDA